VGNTTIKQDSKFEQLLNERKINVSNKWLLQIQIFSGDAKSKNMAELTGVFGDGWNHHFQHTKLQSMGGKLQITHWGGT
jgi:hypothetical protein